MCTGDNPLTAATIAKEAANMIDLDSNPTKILEVVEIGKGLLITRGSLTTFSMANDIAKYFAILPAMFSVVLPQMQILNIMHLATPQSAILSALIFNAIIIPLLIPTAMRGVKFKPMKSEHLLLRNFGYLEFYECDMLRTLLSFFVVMLILCTLIYPFALNIVAKFIFPYQSSGSLVDKEGRPTLDISKAVGSKLLG